MSAMDLSMNRSFQSSFNQKPSMLSLGDIIRKDLIDKILVHNLATQKKIDSPLFEINAVVFSPDRDMFVSAHNNLIDAVLKVWSSQQAKLIVEHKNNDEISAKCIVFNQSGSTLLSGSGKQLYFWDTQSWRQTRHISLDTVSDIQDVNALAFSNSGKSVIVGGCSGKNNLAVISQKLAGSSISVFFGHPETDISCVGFCPDGTRVVSVGDNEFKIWDVARKELIQECSGTSWSNCKVACGKNNEWHLSGYDEEDGVLGCWFLYYLNDPSLSKVRIPLRGQILSQVKAYERSACGNYVFLGDAEKGNINVFNLSTGTYMYTIPGNGSCISTIACSPDGKYMVAAIKGSLESSLLLYDLMLSEDHNALCALNSLAQEQLEYIQHIIFQEKSLDGLDKEKHNNIIASFPFVLQALIRKLLVPKKSDLQDSLLDQGFVIIDEDNEDEWTMLD